MTKLYLRMRSWFGREEGQDLAEYALLIGLIALVVILAVTFLGGQLSSLFSTIGSHVAGWP